MSTIKYINNKVAFLTNKFKTRDPFEICQNLDIHIYYKDLGDTLKAYYFYHSRIDSIVINSRASLIFSRILCAHELGHAVLHKRFTTIHGFKEVSLFDFSIPAEYEANLFAAELIIADSELLELIKDEEKDFFTIAKELCVPPELLDFKLRILYNKGIVTNIPFIATSNFLKNSLL